MPDALDAFHIKLFLTHSCHWKQWENNHSHGYLYVDDRSISLWRRLTCPKFITSRKRSLGKVMFSSVRVCPWGRVSRSLERSHSRYLSLPPHIHTGPVKPYLLITDIWWSSLETCSDVFTWESIPPSGSHQNTYSWQAGGTYNTRMLSCWLHIHIDNMIFHTVVFQKLLTDLNYELISVDDFLWFHHSSASY